MQPHSNPCRIEIVLKSGKRKYTSVDHPRGHVKNPASDEDIERKFVGLNQGMMSRARVRRLLDLCWKLDELDDVSEITGLFRVPARYE